MIEFDITSTLDRNFRKIEIACHDLAFLDVT